MTKPDRMVGLLFALLILLFLWPGLLAGRTLIPADVLHGFAPWNGPGGGNPLMSDMALQNYPWKLLTREALSSGQFPLWNPYVLTGVPFFAAAQASVLYPLGLPLFILLPIESAYTWFFGLHLLIAALGTYWFLRLLRTSRPAAALGGMVFGLGGFLVVSVQWPQAVGTMVWLPVLMGCIELSLRDPPFPERSLRLSKGEGRRPDNRLLPLLGGAAVVACQFLAGQPELSLYLLSSAGAYTAARLMTGLRAPGLLRRAAGPLLMVLAGALLAGVQLVPFLDAVGANQRAGQAGFDQVRAWALPVSQLAGFLVPDFFGNPLHLEPSWGAKNYVEGAAYLGVLPLLLVIPAWALRRDFTTLFFTGLGLFSLLMAFGTPLYGLLFFTIPGFDQLHTPFRWVFPYSFCIAILAARGLDALMSAPPFTGRLLGGASLAAGVLTLIGAWRPAVEWFASRSQAVQAAFTSPDAFITYQTGNFLVPGLLLVSAGILILSLRGRHEPPLNPNHGKQPPVIARSGGGGEPAGATWQSGGGGDAGHRQPKRPNWRGIALVLLLLLAAADLLHFGWGFVSFSDPAGLRDMPPVLAALPKDGEPYRIVAFGEGKLLPPNSAMLAGLQDVRGYDTIIPKAFVDYWGRMEPPSGLPYSQIDRLARPQSLDSPLLDLMNIRYVLSREPLERSGLRLAYRGEVFVYENQRALPRAFAVSGALDPERPRSAIMSGQVLSYRLNEVKVSATLPEAGELVLTDAYAPGWRARDQAGRELPVIRAYGLFRAVELPPGQHTITFSYFPDSLKLGLYLTFLGAVVCAALAAAALWQRHGALLLQGSTGRRLAKNALAPMTAQVVARSVDLGFSIFLLRILGPVDYGGYAFAGALVGYFAIVTGFGMDTLLTREVARDPQEGRRYVSGVITLRLLLCLLAAPVLAAIAWAYNAFFGLSEAATLTALLFMAALVPSSVSAALSALFYAHERMEVPAGVTIVTSVARALLGVSALLLGWGLLGMGAVAIGSSALTAVIFWRLAAGRFFMPRLGVQAGFALGLLRTSVPLVLNSLLNTLFFRIDVLLLQAFRTTQELGMYATAYKFVDALLIIPSAFVLALFPIMSRQGRASHDELLRTYSRGLRALLLVALPVCVVLTVGAEVLVVTLFGEAYREASGLLRVLIWFLPFSYVNGITQYVLISLDRQRYITGAFAVATAFNIAANLLVLPAYGAYGAAFVTVLSEVVLLVPFGIETVRLLGMPNINPLALREDLLLLATVIPMKKG